MMKKRGEVRWREDLEARKWGNARRIMCIGIESEFPTGGLDGWIVWRGGLVR
jgi:hypothetical protein